MNPQRIRDYSDGFSQHAPGAIAVSIARPSSQEIPSRTVPTFRDPIKDPGDSSPLPTPRGGVGRGGTTPHSPLPTPRGGVGGVGRLAQRGNDRVEAGAGGGGGGGEIQQWEEAV